ncbi:MAG: hypothetical protein K6C40_12925, partial [Thermoguttaceae bacterium]|nr:hypothetical protein [Thermoguttaceae bacterium]
GGHIRTSSELAGMNNSPIEQGRPAPLESPYMADDSKTPGEPTDLSKATLPDAEKERIEAGVGIIRGLKDDYIENVQPQKDYSPVYNDPDQQTKMEERIDKIASTPDIGNEVEANETNSAQTINNEQPKNEIPDSLQEDVAAANETNSAPTIDNTPSKTI